MSEQFQPISVKDFSTHPWLFKFRCLVDLQLHTIVKFLKPALANLKGNILDVGAGEAPWCSLMPANTHYQGIDVKNSDDFGMLKNKRNIQYYDGGIMPFENASFDSALCIEVLEHTPNPKLLLSEISRVLKGGGVFLLTVPWSARRHHIPYDFHRFSREQLQLLLEDSGFSNINIEERGTDISVIANKIIILNLRMILLKQGKHWLWTLPLALFLAPFTVCFLILAHLAEFLNFGAKEDPLGYFVTATKQSNEDAN